MNAYNESQTNFVQKQSKCVYVLKIIEVLIIVRFFFLRIFHLYRDYEHGKYVGVNK